MKWIFVIETDCKGEVMLTVAYLQKMLNKVHRFTWQEPEFEVRELSTKSQI